MSYVNIKSRLFMAVQHSLRAKSHNNNMQNMMQADNGTDMMAGIKRKLYLLHLQRMRNASGALGDSEECINYVDSHPDLTNDPVVMGIFFILYLHIFVLGLLGNVAILYLTLKNRHLQTVQNIFILNLAISDILMCLTSLPITPITSIYKMWFFASPVCKLIPFIQATSIFVSTFSLSAIAIDRYNLVVRPHCHPLGIRGASIVAVSLWIISAIISMPYGWYMDVIEYDGLCGEYCTETWPLDEVRKGYTLLVLVMQFLFPFATMAVCYYAIFSRLRERAEIRLKKLSERTQLLENSTAGAVTLVHNKDDDTNSPSPEVRQKLMLVAQQRRTTIILASMVLLFGLTWLPHNVVTLVIEYDELLIGEERLYFVSMTAHLISMITNVCNPFLYAWLNPSFKEMFFKMLQRQKDYRNQKFSTASYERKDTIVRNITRDMNSVSGYNPPDEGSF